LLSEDAVDKLERKQVPVSDVRGVDAADGIVEAIVSVTNIVDSVNDIIVPGAYKATLKKRNPKGVWSHDTNIPVAKTLRVEELLPGDTRLPSDLIGKNAGALLVKMQFNLNTSRGRDAFHDVQFFGAEQEWSIGYAVGEGKSVTNSKTGVREIKELELYEYSPVIFGAAPHTRTLDVKDIDAITEDKAKPEDVKIGDFVSWNSSGGTARGKIEYIMREGTLGVPESDFSIDATAEDPAALIRVYKKTSDGWGETEVLVGHKVSTLRKINDLKEIDEIEETKEVKALPSRYSDIDFSIPDGVKKQAEIGLRWSREYGRGGTSVGKNTASYLNGNEEVSAEKARHIARYFPRHAYEMSLPKNSNPSADGYPGNGLIAWKLWGGDEGRRWSEKLVKAMNSRDEEKGIIVNFAEHGMEDGEEGEQLSPRQQDMYAMYEALAEAYGKFDAGVGEAGAHYMTENPFSSEGINCANCVFYEGGKACEIVHGEIEPDAVCKLWIIKESLLTVEDTEEDEDEEEMPLQEMPSEDMMEDSGFKSAYMDDEDDEEKAMGGPIPGHSTSVSDEGHLTRAAILSVRSPADKSYYRKIFAYHYPGTDGTRKTHYGFIHHSVSEDGTPGSANMTEMAAEMTVLNGGRGGTKLRGEHRQKVYRHLARHYRDAGKTPPELKSDHDVDEIMIKSGIISEPLTPKEQEHE
jgi:HK97 family phage prohead protease